MSATPCEIRVWNRYWVELWKNEIMFFANLRFFRLRPCTYYITLTLIIPTQYIETYVYSFKRQAVFPLCYCRTPVLWLTWKLRKAAWDNRLSTKNRVSFCEIVSVPVTHKWIFEVSHNETLHPEPDMAIILGPQLCVKNFFLSSSTASRKGHPGSGWWRERSILDCLEIQTETSLQVLPMADSVSFTPVGAPYWIIRILGNLREYIMGNDNI